MDTAETDARDIGLIEITASVSAGKRMEMYTIINLEGK